jgi:hypothetical protein
MRSLSSLWARLCSWLVDEYERDGLVLVVAGVAIVHKLQPMFGVEL